MRCKSIHALQSVVDHFSVRSKVVSTHGILAKPDTVACLTKNSYQEAKCRAQVDRLYECCHKFYQQNGDEAKSVSCPKASLLRLKLEQRAKAAK